MGEDEGLVVLKWDSHNSDLLKGLDVQRKAKRFTDVTLAVGDFSILAHRVVLSACSTYFRNILTRLSDCPHPVIVLKDPNPRQLAALLDYMYTGQMSIKHEDLRAIIQAADNLGIHLILSSLPPLATSELAPELTKSHLRVKSDLLINNSEKSGDENVISNRPRSQNGGRKCYRPKRLRTSLDSGNVSGSTVSSDANNASPDSLLDRSYQSCPSRGSNHSSSNEDAHPVSAQIGIPDRISEEDERIESDRAHDVHDAPMDYSRQDGTKSNDNKDKRATMSILDSYLRSAPDHGLPHSAHSLVANPNHLAAAQNLAWLSQQGFGGSRQDIGSGSSDRDSDKENRQNATGTATSTSTSTPTATGLPTLSIDIAGRLQKAFWAANFNRDSPYGSWINPAVNPGFAAVAAAAVAAANTPSTSAHSASLDEQKSSIGVPPSSRSSPNSLNGSLIASGSMDLGATSPLPGTSSRGRSGYKGLGRPSPMISSIGPNGKPSVTCEICGKRLADPSSLYRHRKIHSGDKPHKCPYCGRKFIQRYNMTQHIKTHFKERGINSLTANGFNNLASSANGGDGFPDRSDDGEMSDGRAEDEEEGIEEEEEEIEPC